MKEYKTAVILEGKDKLSQVFGEAGKAISKFDKQAKSFSQGFNKIGKTSMVVGTAIGAALLKPISSAMDFETSMMNVSKYVEMNAKETAEYEKKILALSNATGILAVELNGIAANGGQLGIAKKDIFDFTEAVAKVSVAFGMTSDDTADHLAKMMNIFKLDTKHAMLTADAINHITDAVEGNTASAVDIIEVTQRTGGLASLMKLSASDTAALGSAFLSTGQEAEVSATGINALLLALGDPEGQNKNFQAGLAKIGLSAKDLKKAVDKDAKGALLMFLDAVAKLPKEDQIPTLSLLFGREYADNIALVAGNTNVLKKSFAAVADSTQYAGSAEREFNKQLKTSANQFKKTKNEIENMSITIGKQLLPVVNNTMDAIKPILSGLSGWIKENPKLTNTIGTLAMSVAGVSLAIGVTNFAISGLISGLRPAIWLVKTLNAFLVAENTAAAAAAVSTNGLSAAISGVGAMSFAQVAGVMALAGAIAGLMVLYADFAKVSKQNMDMKKKVGKTAEQLADDNGKAKERLDNMKAGWSTWGGVKEKIYGGSGSKAEQKQLEALIKRNNAQIIKMKAPNITQHNTNTIIVNNPKSTVDVAKGVNAGMKTNAKKSLKDK